MAMQVQVSQDLLLIHQHKLIYHVLFAGPPIYSKRVMLTIPDSLSLLAFSEFHRGHPLPPIISCILHKIYKHNYGKQKFSSLFVSDYNFFNSTS